MMRYDRWAVAMVVMLALASCGTAPDTVVRHQAGDPVTPVPPSLWERLTNRTGQVTGHLLLPDGSPAAGFSYVCTPLFEIPEGRSTIGSLLGTNGEFLCGGPAGSYQLEVYDNHGAGIIGGQPVEVHAWEHVTLDVMLQP